MKKKTNATESGASILFKTESMEQEHRLECLLMLVVPAFFSRLNPWNGSELSGGENDDRASILFKTESMEQTSLLRLGMS